MVKVGRTLSIENSILTQMDEQARRSGRSLNRECELAFHEYVKRRREPQELQCPHCGAKYSEVLGVCPICEAGKVAVAKRSRLVLELEGVAKTLIAVKEQVGRATTKLKNMESFLDDGKATVPEIEKAAVEQTEALGQLAVVQGEYDRLEREIAEIEKNSERGVLE